jgi:hypothetical protein
MKDKENRVEDILIVLLLNSMKNSTITEKATQLNLAGLSNIEIANFLETSSQVIANALSASRKIKKKSKGKD